MVESEQIRPLAPASAGQVRSDEEAAPKPHGGQRRRCYICCGSCAAIFVILGLLILILALTVFKVKEPKLNMNSVQVNRMNVNKGNSLGSPISLNMTLTADLSVKNSNVASFKFSNATTLISYRGVTIGEAQSPAGNARARRTLRMNVTVHVMVDQLSLDPTMISEIASGRLTIGSNTELGGRINVLNIFKHHAHVKLRCNVTISISDRAIQDQSCDRRVKL